MLKRSIWCYITTSTNLGVREMQFFGKVGLSRGLLLGPRYELFGPAVGVGIASVELLGAPVLKLSDGSASGG
jgi:hypothetical protein